MEAELIWKGLWNLVFAEVDMDGKTDDEVKVELQKLLLKKWVKKMAEARAEIILCVEYDQLTHMHNCDPKVIWETLIQVHHACGLDTRMVLQWKLLMTIKGIAEALSAWISHVKGMTLDLENIGGTIDNENQILVLITRLNKLYNPFVISLNLMITPDLIFDHVVNHLLNKDV